MFSPHDVSLIQLTIFISVHLDIPTGYEPGLNVLPNSEAANIGTRRKYSPRFCTSRLPLTHAVWLFQPQPFRAATRRDSLVNMVSTKFTCKHGSTEMLNDRNYHSWKRSLKTFLIAEDAFGIAIGTEVRTRAQPLSSVIVAAAPDGPIR
jgi:hypothetical protein